MPAHKNELSITMNRIKEKPPIFIMSLDKELLWGYTRHPDDSIIDLIKKDNTKVRNSVDILLRLLEKHNIPATWAVVGQLFLDPFERIEKNINKNILFNYNVNSPHIDIQEECLYYGRDIIDKILSSKINHELGYHSFSHILFSESSKKVAEAEIIKGMEIAKDLDIIFKSFVFPENKIGHIDILRKYGFKVYRGKTIGNLNLNSNTLLHKIGAGISKVNAPPVEPSFINGVCELPSSMFFCDPQIKSSVLSKSRIGLYRAIRSKKVFHIWMHPHNLLMYPSLRDDLDRFLDIVSKKRDEGLIDVMTMGEFAEAAISRNWR